MEALRGDAFERYRQDVAAVLGFEGAATLGQVPGLGLGGLPDMKMLDVKSMGTPPRFDGTQSRWLEYKFRLTTLLDVPIISGVSLATYMRYAEARGRDGPVTEEEMGPEVKAVSRLLYLLLSQGVGGKALTIVQGVGASNGLEAWRELVNEYEPKNASRRAAMLIGLLGPVSWKGVSMDGFLPAIMAWEKATSEYEQVAGRPLDDDLKLATVAKYAPQGVKVFLKLYPLDFTTYKELRDGIQTFLQKGRTYDSGGGEQPLAMDIGAVYGGKGAPRGAAGGQRAGAEQRRRPGGGQWQQQRAALPQGPAARYVQGMAPCRHCGGRHLHRQCPNVGHGATGALMQ